MRVAIVGAGVSGLAVARTLLDAGHAVTVLDKGRGVGGRVTTRRREQGAFDHGAQRFSARGEVFRARAESWEASGLLVRTAPTRTDEPWFIATPSMSALAHELARGIDVRTSARVTSLRRVKHAWRLTVEGEDDAGPFDVVVVTAPAPQAGALLAPLGVFAEPLASLTYDPCWALMLQVDRVGLTLDEAIFTEGAREDAIALLVREGLKPGRVPDDALVRLVVHASTEFSTRYLEASEDEVIARLLTALRSRPGLAALRTRSAQAHRWRFARVRSPLGEPFLLDRDRGVAVAGDAMLGSRIESAYESGLALAASLLA